MADRSRHPAPTAQVRPATRGRDWELAFAIAPDATPAARAPEDAARRLLAVLLARQISAAPARAPADAPQHGTGQGGGVGAAANEPAAPSPGSFAAAPAPSRLPADARPDAGGAA